MPHATPLFFSMSDSEQIGAHSSRNNGVLDPSVGVAVQSGRFRMDGFFI